MYLPPNPSFLLDRRGCIREQSLGVEGGCEKGQHKVLEELRRHEEPRSLVGLGQL